MASTRGRDPAVEEEFLGALYKGGELLASGKIVEAREHLEKAHGLAPKNEKAQNLLGLTYFKLGLFDRASEVYEKLVNENPADATLRVNLGLVYLKTNNLERCIKEFETATDLEPTHKKAHNYLGLALAQQGTYAKAKEHFELAGSEQMAEKMSRAIANASSPSGIHTPVARQGPKTVVLGEDDGSASASASSSYKVPLGEGDPSASSVYRALKLPIAEKPAAPPPPPTPIGEEEAIEVMSDEEVPSEAFVVPDDAVIPATVAEAPPPPPENDDALNSDWGAALPSSPGRASVEKKAAPDEMRFAEDEGPSFPGSRPASDPSEAEMPVLDAVVDVEASEPMPETQGDAVVEIEATVEVMPDTPLEAATEVEVEPDEILDDDAIIDASPEAEPAPASASAPAPAPASAPAPAQAEPAPEAIAAEPPPPAPVPSVPSPAWLTESQEAPVAEAPPADAGWVAAPVAEVNVTEPAAPPPKRKWAAADAEVSSWGATSSSAETIAEEPLPAEAAPAIAPLEMPPLGPVTSPSQITEAPTEEIPAAQPIAADDASWATGAAESAAQAVAAEAVPSGTEYAEAGAVADESSWATEPAAETPMESLPSTVDDASWATGGGVAAVAPQPETLPSTPDDDSWATGAAGAEEPQAEASARTEWATEQVADVEASASWAANSQPVRAAAPEPALDPVPEAHDVQTPAPSAPLPITVEEPADAPAVIAPPAGYSAMQPQRLVDLGASGAWVHEPSAGPFHLSTDGLAVTIAGEMLMRMHGLIAVVGSINVNPEHRRRRGRPTQEPFGAGPNQLQRVTGNGVVYLEPGRSKFHAVDLTDQNGVNIDDDGAYLREELVFAFEEPISYENGKLSNDAQALELAHLKGTGRVLLQLDGTLRAMPIPVAAPLVVPVQRVVGWFGRVTPRLMGFGGRGAVELTGEGYALLGTPVGA